MFITKSSALNPMVMIVFEKYYFCIVWLGKMFIEKQLTVSNIQECYGQQINEFYFLSKYTIAENYGNYHEKRENT